MALAAIGPASLSAAAELPPPGFKVAFIGDQGFDEDGLAVMDLILAEEADAVMHLGDFDYDHDPRAWNSRLNKKFGRSFPYFACVGNHDDEAWKGSKGYQHYIEARLKRIGVPWEGDLGVKSTFSYRGIFFVLTAPGIFGDGDEDYAPFLMNRLAADHSAWRIAGWHVNQEAMQVGDKDDEAGWRLYEEARRGGAIIATAHSHEYGRTHPLSSCENQIVAATTSSFALRRDLAATPHDDGVTFVFHSGLGGHSIREQVRCMPSAPPHGCNGEWASIYAEQQGADYGALFGVFHVDGDPCLARFYFKDIGGAVIDEFWVTSTLGPCNTCPADVDGSGRVDQDDIAVLVESWGNCAADIACDSDLNADGVTGIRDLLSMLANWGVCKG